MKPNPGRASEPYPAENFTKIRARPGGFVCALQCALPGCCVRESALAAGILEMRRRHQWPESRLQLASQSRDRPGQVRAHSHIHKQFFKNVFFIFGSDRSSINADLCACVRSSGSSLSRAVNLHHSGSNIQQSVRN